MAAAAAEFCVKPLCPRAELLNAAGCPVLLWSVLLMLSLCTWTVSAARCAGVSTAHTPPLLFQQG